MEAIPENPHVLVRLVRDEEDVVIALDLSGVGSVATRPRESRSGGTPAIRVRLSRFRSTVQQGPVQRQKTQIVQPCKTLDNFLPGFTL